MSMFYKVTTANDDLALENLIDECGVASILQAIGAICHEKAEHIRSSYDAHDADARTWERIGNKVSRLGCSIADA